MPRVRRRSSDKKELSTFPLVLLWFLTSLSKLPFLLIINAVLTLKRFFSLVLSSMRRFIDFYKEAFSTVYKVYIKQEFSPTPEPLLYQPEPDPVPEKIEQAFLTLPDLTLPPLKKKRKRGRPRKSPFYHYYIVKIRRFFKKLLPTPLRVGIAAVVIAVLFFSFSLFLVNIVHELPSPDKLNADNGPITTEFYDRNGQLLYRYYEGKNRTLVKLSDLPPNLINATVAIEDKNYWTHPGFDVIGIARAIINDYQNHGNTLQGGSTITQQLIKNTLLTPDQTFQRKIKEVFLSFWAERIFNKQQILEMYFNEVGYGGPAWGVEAASETYFGKSAHDLDLAQSAYLAGLPASPTTYSPYGENPELGFQ